ncbi:MAG: P-loop NTPase, partial [Myxococcota bacterium]
MTEQRRIIAVGGGKGGVGKSIVAVNLAVVMAQLGRTVALVDADLGSANQHTMLGIDRPGPSLYGVIRGEIPHLRHALMRTAVPNLLLVPGAGAIPGSANLSEHNRHRLLEEIRSLPVDVTIVDVGAGISFEVIDMYILADQRIVVVLPQLTSFQNAYSFLKSAVHRTVYRCADTRERRQIYAQLDPS